MNAGPKPLTRPFTFDLSFDEDPVLAKRPRSSAPRADAGSSPPAPTPPPPTFSREDLQAAHEDGYQAGREAALKEAGESVEQGSAAALERIAAALHSLDTTRAAANDDIARHAAEIAVGIARKLMPHLAERHGLAEVEALVGDALANLLEPVKVTVRVSPDIVPILRKQLADLAAQAGFEGRTVVAEDPALGPGDAVIDWGDGGASHDSARIWREIDAAIAAMVERSGRSTPERLVTAAPATPAAPPAERTAEPVAEPAAEPIAEPIAEPAASPTARRQAPQPKVRPVRQAEQ